jgi:hypothetical protein
MGCAASSFHHREPKDVIALKKQNILSFKRTPFE